MPLPTPLSHHDRLIQTAALRLLRACGERALFEARGWCRYFARECKAAERDQWARIALEIRRQLRAEPVSQAA